MSDFRACPSRIAPSERSPEKPLGPVAGGEFAVRVVGPPAEANAPDSSSDSPPPVALDLEAAPLPEDDQTSHKPAPLPQELAGGIGTLLEPVLARACDGRLSAINWFRTDWQRGGAVTGYAQYTDDDGRPRDVVVKMPVPPCERHWLVALQQAGDIVPKAYAHGESLNGYDLAWIVMERLPHGPLGPNWQGNEFDLLIDALGRFYLAAQEHPLTGSPLRRDWEKVHQRARDTVRDSNLPEQQRWQQALKKAQKKLKEWVSIWEDRPIDGWCHGDVHLANAMTREPAPAGPALLFDFALTRIGHWVEDAIYLEHLFWAHRDRLGGRKLAKQIAHTRRSLGLPVEDDWARLAQAKRALLAMAAPAMLGHEGDAAHLRAALEVLEREA